MRQTNFVFNTPDGADLFAYCWLPSGPPRALVQIVHGLAEHAGRYARLAEALTGAGYGVFACDLRGHGRTAKAPQDLGFMAASDGWNKVLSDLWQLHQHMAKQFAELPVVLLGHSMGATLARQVIAEHSEALAGAVLSGCSGQPTLLAAAGRFITRAEQLRLGPRAHSSLVQSLTFEAFNRKFQPARTGFDWLSRDPAEVDKYVADPLCGFAVPVRLWVEMLDGWAEAARWRNSARVRKDFPLYVIAGSHDPVSEGTRMLVPMLAQYQAAGLTRLEHRFYHEGRHELLNEINRDEVTSHLTSWLERITSRK